MRMLALGVVFLATGCAYQTANVPVSQPLQVTSVAVNGPGANDDSVKVARERATHMIRRASRHAHGDAGAIAMNVTLDKPDDYLSFLSEDGIALTLLVWPMLAGMVTERAKLGVDVAIESHGRTLHGHGDAQREGSIYAPAMKRALAVALSSAIASAR